MNNLNKEKNTIQCVHCNSTNIEFEDTIKEWGNVYDFYFCNDCSMGFSFEKEYNIWNIYYNNITNTLTFEENEYFDKTSFTLTEEDEWNTLISRDGKVKYDFQLYLLDDDFQSNQDNNKELHNVYAFQYTKVILDENWEETIDTSNFKWLPINFVSN
jgi:hypothetical protein